MSKIAERLIEAVKCGEVSTRDELQDRKIKLCGELGLKNVPPNSEILAEAADEDRELVLPLLIKKPMRTASGTAVVAVMASPHPCPHGKCTFCPGGVENGSPQSYTGKEPAARRAGRNLYDPYMQVTDRIRQLEAIGHDASKIDLIVMGGTFTCRDREYKEWFVKRCFDAMNGTDSADLASAQDLNENAEHRCVAMAVETRPDTFSPSEAQDAMRLGVTRVEIGVQILDDEILGAVNRGHTVEDIVESTRACKEAGIPVVYHIMPGLPGSDPGKDMECFRRIFSDPDFRPDGFKFYTTLVIPGTKLYDLWKDGGYEPYDTEEAVALLAEMKAAIPEYVRIQRIQRDIPVPEIAAGILKSNLRQLVQDRMAEQGRKCRCLRCREVGHTGEEPRDPREAELRTVKYEASGGTEHFISYEFRDSVIGYARLRTDGSGTAAIRDMKVSGSFTPVSGTGSWQRRGYDINLVSKAEEVAASAGASVVRVTCGPGARGFYRALGYELDRPYMTKRIS
ncbi:MAG: elongator complex protein 3 [Candidatus Methanomethylophilaceae archaeon]|nr:elongator complex protein 3 [Candidatus Methanomethylophilaceae archaeon]